ncbi:ACP1, partial [Symbiodinium necroappetens]
WERGNTRGLLAETVSEWHRVWQLHKGKARRERSHQAVLMMLHKWRRPGPQGTAACALSVWARLAVKRRGRSRAAAAMEMRPSVPQWPAAALRIRGFSSEPSMEERVIGAVKRYIEARKDDLSRDNDVDALTKSEILKAFEKDVSSATTWDDLKFDDVDKVEVLLEVEEEFNHVMPDAVADKLSSVKEVIDYMQQK